MTSTVLVIIIAVVAVIGLVGWFVNRKRVRTLQRNNQQIKVEFAYCLDAVWRLAEKTILVVLQEEAFAGRVEAKEKLADGKVGIFMQETKIVGEPYGLLEVYRKGAPGQVVLTVELSPRHSGTIMLYRGPEGHCPRGASVADGMENLAAVCRDQLTQSLREHATV